MPPAKVQSALLEAMGERQITVGSVTYPLPTLFMVMATQNPIEQEGTYPLPEAQLDRFLMHVLVRYPDAEGERAILEINRGEQRKTGGDDVLFSPETEVLRRRGARSAHAGAADTPRRGARGIHRADRARDALTRRLRRRSGGQSAMGCQSARHDRARSLRKGARLARRS